MIYYYYSFPFQYFWAVVYELSEQQLRAFIFSLVFPLHSQSNSSNSNAANLTRSQEFSNSSNIDKLSANRLGSVDFLSFASYATFSQYANLTQPGVTLSKSASSSNANSATNSSNVGRPVNTFIYFQIIAPTALALLSPDSADITVFEFTNKKSVSESPYLSLKISIPRYSNLQIMAQKVMQLVNISLNVSAS